MQTNITGDFNKRLKKTLKKPKKKISSIILDDMTNLLPQHRAWKAEVLSVWSHLGFQKGAVFRDWRAKGRGFTLPPC